MAHPVIRPIRPRAAAIAGLAGGLLLVTGPATALTGLTDGLSDTCRAVEVLDPACDLVEETVETVDEVTAPALDPVTEPVEEALAPVVEALPSEVLPEEILPADAVPPPAEGGGEAPAAGGDGGSEPAAGSGSGSQGEGTDAGGDGGEVAAVGKDPVEIIEPQGPTADGRITGGPTLQPTDLRALGNNISGIGSQSGLTLQPYDAAAPLVSVPAVEGPQVPQVAGAPVTTASPVAAMAAEAMSFTGDVVLPQTGAEAAMVTATGIGLLAGGAYVMRRRPGGLSLTALDDRLLPGPRRQS